MSIPTTRPKRSAWLTPDEMRKYRRWVKSCGTKRNATEKLGVTMITLNNILLKGRGLPATIDRIKEILSGQNSQ